MPVVSHQNGYTTDIGSNFAEAQDDVNLQASDLAILFDQILYGAGVPMYATYNGGNPYYGVTSFTAIHTQPTGWYAFNVNVTESAGNEGQASIFVRGIRNASLEAQYFGQDGHDSGAVISMGGAGIYLNPLPSGKLRINIKTYVDGAFVPNVYYVAIESNDITVADNGSVVTILAGGKKVATIEIIGTKEYTIKDQHGNVVDLAADALAEKAILTLADGTVVELDNACVAAKIEGSDLGIATRTGTLNFNKASLLGYNTVEIPEEFYLPEMRENVATGAAVSADSVENETNIPSNATDGNDATRWGATPNGLANLVVDLGAVYELTDLNTQFVNASWNYTIAVSVDGEEYTVIYEDGPHAAKIVKLHSDEPIDVRYIKYTRLEDGNEGNHWFSIYEVIAYGTLKEGQEAAAPLTVEFNAEANAPLYDADGWPEAGITGAFVKLGYNNYVVCGELDLSKYSKAEIVYSFDGTVGVTDERLNAAPSKAIGLKSEASAYGWETTEPNFTGDLGHTDMVFSNTGWTDYRTAEIDLTAVDYNGNVWISVYNPLGTEIVIHSLTLIP
jgi:hypothetical protein